MAQDLPTDHWAKGREIILEMRQIGSVVKVSAFDVQTMLEVSVQVPSSLGEAGAQQAVLKRLQYVLRKQGKLA